jgi:signal transduction histidine kinase
MSLALDQETAAAAPRVAVSFETIAGFLRLLSHDVRNDLNAVDLLTAYIQDISGAEPIRGELDQLRTAIRYGSERMHRLSRAFEMPRIEAIEIPVHVLIEDLRSRMLSSKPEAEPRLLWNVEDEDANIYVDPTLALEVFFELTDNALAFSTHDSSVSVGVFRDESDDFKWCFEQGMKDPPSHPDQWGRVPFLSARRGHYGLGLFRARRIVDAHKGAIEFSHDRQTERFSTVVRFPRGVVV